MEKTISAHFDLLEKRFPALVPIMGDIIKAYEILETSFLSGGKLLLCGNGGSAADCQHIAGELMKGFLQKRPLGSEETAAFERLSRPDLPALLQGALPAVSLTNESALISAYINDVSPDMIFAQQAYGLAREHDVLLGISTSGNSKNVVNAVIAARARGAATIGLTGADGGALHGICGTCVRVPETETFMVQELHLPVYHALCAALEARFFA